MDRHTDFSKRAVVHSADEPWVASPMAGVSRRVLDRIGDEVARATTVVRYDAGSAFSPHVHTGGEEFLVLEGVFQDEHGDFPAGSYIRNPPQSSHTPRSDEGCIILVKLWQFDMADRTHVRIDTNKMRFVADRDNARVSPLFSDGQEDVSLEQWSGDAQVSLDAPEGAEVFVLEGSFEEAGEAFKVGSWLRLPKGGSSVAKTGAEGAKVWVKRDHLRNEPKAPAV